MRLKDIVQKPVGELYEDRNFQLFVEHIFRKTMGVNPSRGRDPQEAIQACWLHIVRTGAVTRFRPGGVHFSYYIRLIIRRFFIGYSKKAQSTPTDIGISIVSEVMFEERVPFAISMDSVCVVDPQRSYEVKLLYELDAAIERADVEVLSKTDAVPRLVNVYRLLRRGHTQVEVARMYGVSVTGVGGWYKKIKGIAQELCADPQLSSL